MIVNVQSGSGGFAKYVIEGTVQKPRNKEKIEIVGDPSFVEKISKEQGNGYFKILVSAEKKLSNNEMKEILEEALKNIFIGFDKDEYIYSAVLHQDTEHSHWHIIVPKQNLLTNQQLRLYMHNIDTKRYQALQEHIALKFNLKTLEEIKPIIQEQKETTYEKNSTTPIQYTLQNKADKALAEQQIKELIKNNIDSINSIDEIKKLIHENTNLKVVANGYDRKKQFHSITIQDDQGKKTRVKGEMFNADNSFFKQTKQEQRNQLQVNHKTYSEVEKELLIKKIRSDLRRENEKRYKVVQNYGRKLKETLRAKQAVQEQTFKKEKTNDTTRTNVTESPSREPRITPKRKRQRSNPTTKSAILINQERIRIAEEVRRARERVLKELETNSSREQEVKRSLISRVSQAISRVSQSIKSKLKSIISTSQIEELSSSKIIEKAIEQTKAKLKPLEQDMQEFIATLKPQKAIKPIISLNQNEEEKTIIEKKTEETKAKINYVEPKEKEKEEEHIKIDIPIVKEVEKAEATEQPKPIDSATQIKQTPPEPTIEQRIAEAKPLSQDEEEEFRKIIERAQQQQKRKFPTLR